VYLSATWGHSSGEIKFISDGALCQFKGKPHSSNEPIKGEILSWCFLPCLMKSVPFAFQNASCVILVLECAHSFELDMLCYSFHEYHSQKKEGFRVFKV
jgi:hypothetical protein